MRFPGKNILHWLEKTMTRFLRLNTTGLLGTILFHLIVLFVFLSTRLVTRTTYPPKEILIDFPEELKTEEIEKLEQIQKDQPAVENMADRFIGRNIAVDVTDKTIREVSTEKYIQELENQMDLPGFKALQNPQNLLTEQPDQSSNNAEQGLQVQENQPEKKQESNKIYHGPTNIWYELNNRKHRYIAIPVYRCEGYGLVVTEIYVDQQGNVVSASVIREKSTTADECLLEAALQYALRSKFNVDLKAPAKQKGTITYQFIPQQ